MGSIGAAGNDRKSFCKSGHLQFFAFIKIGGGAKMPADGSLDINFDDRTLCDFLACNSEDVGRVEGYCYSITPCIPMYLFMD